MKPIHLITIGYAKQALQKGSREHVRMLMYAREIDSFHIIVFTRKKEGFSEVVTDGNLSVHPTHSCTRVHALFDAYKIARAICRVHREKTFIVSAQDPLEIGVLSWLLSLQKNVRLHIQVHGDYFGKGWLGHSMIRRLKRFFARTLLRRAPAVRVVSQRIKDSLIAQGVPPDRITVLPIRPELETFLAVSKEERNDGVCRYLFVGRLAPEKNVARIIKAFEKVYIKNKHVHLTIVGSGMEETMLKALAKSLGIDHAVTWIPWTQNVAEIMRTSDVLVLASKHEAYGLVLLEAMAVGLTLVTTDVGCVGEVVEDGVHGVVVRDEGVVPFADAMYAISGDVEMRKRFGIQGKVTAKHIAQMSASSYVDAWVSALAQSLD